MCVFFFDELIVPLTVTIILFITIVIVVMVKTSVSTSRSLHGNRSNKPTLTISKLVSILSSLLAARALAFSASLLHLGFCQTGCPSGLHLLLVDFFDTVVTLAFVRRL